MSSAPSPHSFATIEPTTSRWIGEATGRHAIMLALFAAGLVLATLAGAHVDWRAYGVIGAWTVTHFLMAPWAARPHDFVRRLSRYAWTVVADIAFLAFVVLFLDAAQWLGAVFFVHPALVAAATLPRRWAVGIAVLIVGVYSALVVFAVAGPAIVVSPVHLPSVRGNWAFAAASIAAATGLIVILMLLQARLVETIRDVEQRYVLLVQSVPDMVMTFDADGRFVDVNPATEAQSGYTWDEIKQLPNPSFFPPEDWPRVRDALVRNLRGETVTMDIRYVRKSGEMRWLHTTSTPFQRSGDRGAVLAIARDVTETRRQADALRANQAQLALIVSSLDLGFYTTDLDQVVTAVHGRWAEENAITAGAIIGRRTRDLVPPRWADAHEQAHQRALAGEHVTLQWSVAPPFAPRERFFRAQFAPMRDTEGAITGVAGIWSDVSAAVVAERESALLRDRVASADRAESLGKLVSGVAHELNNPLAAILNFTEDLLEDGRPVDDRLALEVIQSQALRARTIVRDLLAYVRGGHSRPREIQPPGPVLETLLRRVRTGLETQGVGLQAIIGDPGTPLLLDRAGFDQVVTNILTNAAQSAGAGGAVRLVAGRQGDVYRVVVEDNGPGVPGEHMAHIFEPFFTTRPAGQGVGLGLSVSLGIVRAHGGTLVVENPDVGGARFTLNLPVVTGAAPFATAGPDAEVGGARAGAAAKGRGASVATRPSLLLVDDEASIRSALRRYFERRGWLVDEAAEGATALQKLLYQDPPARFDVVLCDLKMPGVSGMEMYGTLVREAPALARRVIVSTGDASAADVAGFLATVSAPVLEKPFELAALERLARKVLAEAAGDGGELETTAASDT